MSTLNNAQLAQTTASRSTRPVGILSVYNSSGGSKAYTMFYPGECLEKLAPWDMPRCTLSF